jgi:sterol desaturase/sphingolipid hydroxylase (fatty acid hydroxylase superfamily)
MIFPLWSVPVIAIVVWIVWSFERKFPAGELPLSAVIIDYKLAALRFGINQLILPITAASGVMIVNTLGGGWIKLRSDGWWFLLSVVVFILVYDLWSYIAHRAEHKFAVLWAIHSLHHSAQSLSIITGLRHFWLEDAIHAAFFPVMAIIFKVPSEMVTTVAAIYFLPEGFAHTNIRLSLGRFALIINNPQYHRIHHSIEPQHRDKNFCRMLPLFDVIFGTAWKPGKDEFPKTGLAGEKATGFLDGIIWPVRQRLSWRSSGLTVAVGNRID